MVAVNFYHKPAMPQAFTVEFWSHVAFRYANSFHCQCRLINDVI